MPTAKPRLNLTLQQHRYDLLKRLADIQGVSMSSVVTDVMEEVYPVLERVCVVLEAAQLAKKTSKEGLREAISKAEGELAPILYRAVDQFDMFIDDAAAALGVDPQSSPKAAEAIRKAQGIPSAGEGGEVSARAEAPPPRRRGGPRPVIRGSGSTPEGG